MTDFNREKLCNCGICKLCYEVVDFVDMLADEQKRAEIERELQITQPVEDARAKFLACILVGAAAEFGFRNGCPPEQLFQWMIYFWNKRASIATQNVMSGNPEGSPEILKERKLEDYQS